MFPIEIAASYKNLSIPKSLGNHLLNFWFCCTLSKIHGYELLLPCLSDIESVLDIKVRYFPICRHHKLEHDARYSEETAFSGKTPEEVAALSLIQRKCHLDLLERGLVCNCTINGNFWHADLFLDQNEYTDFFTVKENPRPLRENAVLIHHRGTDAKNHLRNIYPKGICLTTEYYARAIAEAIKHFGNSVKFYVITDDIDDALVVLPKIEYTIIDTNAPSSWLIAHYAKNIICSNSSFCWTAALWNKEFRVMPAGGYNCNYPGTGVVPAGFYLPGAIIV